MPKYQKTNHPSILRYFGKKGPVYVIDYYASGKRHREKVGLLLGEAQKRLADVKAKAKSGDYIPQSIKRKITLETIISAYRKNREGNGYYERSEKYHLDMLEGAFGKKRLCEITPQVIEDFRKQRQDEPTRNGKKRSDTTINRELEILRRLLNKAVLNEQLEKNPFDRFRDHGEEIFFEEAGRLRYLEKDEINSLLEEAPVYLQRIIKGAILTGLRKGDLLKIKWTDINLEKGTLTYYEQKKRGKKPIIKYLNQDMINLLMKTPAKGECVFLGPDGKPLKNVTRSFKTALRKAGIENFRFHDLRHTSASLLVMGGASMKYVQEHLGHSDIKTTQRYTQLSEEFQKQEIQKLNGLFVTGEKTVRNSENKEKLETQHFVTV